MPFADVVGHRRVLGLLARSIARDRLPPSLLFSGPAGVGKATAALALAQVLNCQARAGAATGTDLLFEDPDRNGREGTFEVDACGRCAACRRIARNVHADVVWVEPGEGGAIKIDQARVVVDAAMYRPFEGRRRVVIIDQAEALGAPSQNALLKTLEEPPPASVFVLVTSRPGMLLPTVLSRCAHLRFGRLAATEVASILIGAHGYADADAHAAAAVADGSVGSALEAQADDLSAARAAAGQVLRAISAGADVRRRLEAAKTLLPKKAAPGFGERDHLALHLRAMSSLLRDLGAVRARAVLANADMGRALDALAEHYDPDRTLRAFTVVDRALEALEGNTSAKIVADWVTVQL
jgi:DNA polymerase-3 subunit delta'